MLRILNRSRNYFSGNFDTSKLSHIGDVKDGSISVLGKIISTKLKNKTIRENLDPRNISAIHVYILCAWKRSVNKTCTSYYCIVEVNEQTI